MAAPKKPMDHLRKEGESLTPKTSFATVTLHGSTGTVEVEVLDPTTWAFDVQDMIAANRFGAVFDAIMDAENAAKARSVRPSVSQAVVFLAELVDADGASLGESRAS
jgi:hypothetical protein